MIEKELSQIAENWSEPEYRERPELSYSTLSTYESVGFNGLDHLFDKKESSSLTFGSIVDCVITGGEEEFDANYMVVDFTIGDKESKIADYLFNQFRDSYASIETIPSTYILDAANTFEFQKNWRDETRIKVITERCSKAYQIKYVAIGKTIINSNDYSDAMACVSALRESPATCGYFAENDDMSPVRRYYQLKFKACFDGVGYRNMADLIAVDYDKKKVYPIDLKTSSHTEWDFEQSFCTWNY